MSVRRFVGSPALRAAAAFGGFGLAFAAANLLLARVMSPTEFALVALTVAIIQIAMPLAPAGLEVVINRRHLAPSPAMLQQVLSSAGIMGIIGVACAADLYRLSPPLLAAILVATVAGGANYVAAAIYQSREQFRTSLLTSESQNLTLALGGLLVAVTGISAAWLPTAVYAMGYCVLASTGWRRLLSGPRDRTAPKMVMPWGESLPLMGLNAAGLLLVQLERLMVPKLLGLRELAHFSILAVLVGSPFRILQLGVGYTLLPRLRAAGTTHARLRLLAEEGAVALVMSGLLAAGALVVAPWVLEDFLKGKYELSTGLIVVSILAGAAKVLAGFTTAMANALCDRRQLYWLTTLGWAAVAAGVGGAVIGAHWGLKGVIAGVALGWLVRAAVAGLAALPNLRKPPEPIPA